MMQSLHRPILFATRWKAECIFTPLRFVHYATDLLSLKYLLKPLGLTRRRSVDDEFKWSSPSSSADALSKRLGSSHCGTARLRDFHSIEFRPADIPNARSSRCERLLRAPQQLRLRLRCFPRRRWVGGWNQVIPAAINVSASIRAWYSGWCQEQKSGVSQQPLLPQVQLADLSHLPRAARL